jgi:hypothetical protein
MLAGNEAFSPGAYELISTTLITTNTASVSFDTTGLGSTYKHLQIRMTSRSSASSNSQSGIRFNSDSGSNYSEHQLVAGGSSVTSYGGASVNFAPLGQDPQSGNTANLFGGRIIDILDPFSTTKNKTIRSFSGHSGSSSAVGIFSSGWFSTSAVTNLEVFMSNGNFVQYSRLSLYGLKG